MKDQNSSRFKICMRQLNNRHFIDPCGKMLFPLPPLALREWGVKGPAYGSVDVPRLGLNRQPSGRKYRNLAY